MSGIHVSRVPMLLIAGAAACLALAAAPAAASQAESDVSDGEAAAILEDSVRFRTGDVELHDASGERHELYETLPVTWLTEQLLTR